jgi:hypothetical protein
MNEILAMVCIYFKIQTTFKGFILRSLALPNVQLYLVHGILTIILLRLNENIWLISFHFKESNSVFFIFSQANRVETLDTLYLFQCRFIFNKYIWIYKKFNICSFNGFVRWFLYLLIDFVVVSSHLHYVIT